MIRTPFHLVPAALLLPAALCLHADTTGRIAGKVVNRKGEPLPSAVLILKRTDISWTKTLPLTAKGTFMQVGLEPKEFDITVTCNGYTDLVRRVKIPLGDVLNETFTMLTPQEALAEAKATGKAVVEETGAAAENEAAEAANQAFALYREKKYPEAQALLEKAQLHFQESIQKTKDEKIKASLLESFATSERVRGIVTAFNFIDNPSKPELAIKAQPLLEQALAKKADDQFALQAMVEMARAKKDTELEKKYRPAYDKIYGPKPENAYNDAVTAFNAGKGKEAKEHLLKAIQLDPKFSESYYLMGMVEYGNNNLKACKEALLKYLELDPNGKKAGEVKEMLNDPTLKKIK